MRHERKTNPPGRVRIMQSLSGLMAKKDFHSITTAEIARNAGVTEGLIYKYFSDKKDLLYQVLKEHFELFQKKVELKISQAPTCTGKIEVIIHTSLESYAANRVFSRILLLEVRNSSDFFKSSAYKMVRAYSRTILTIIEQGIQKGELKPDTDPVILRKVILGAIEHACLGEIIFGRELDINEVSRGISTIIFQGVKV